MAGRRVHFLAGAPGAGKTAIAPLVATRLPNFVVLDMDLLLDPASELVGRDLRDDDAAPLWPAYNDLWLRVVGSIALRRAVLLLGPLTPDGVEGSPARSSIGEIEWAVLDCSDEVRRARLARRGYGESAIKGALADAAAARALGLHVISTDDATPEQTADHVARWANLTITPS